MLQSRTDRQLFIILQYVLLKITFATVRLNHNVLP